MEGNLRHGSKPVRVPPLVSILIPAFNAESLLPQTLHSALNQSWENIEVIVVDDGSTDRTLERSNSIRSHKIKVIHQENGGQSSAFNRAMREAQGDYFEFLDADDVLAHNKIELQMALADKMGPEFMFSGAWTRFQNKIEEAIFCPEPVWRDLTPVDWLVESWMGGGMMHGAAWLTSRKVAERGGPWDESLSLINDLDYFPRLLLASKGVMFCPGARSYYRSGRDSVSNQRSPKACISAFKALRLSREALLQVEDSPRTRLACATSLQRFVFWIYPDGAEFIKDAEREIRQLGGSKLRPTGGRLFQSLSRLLGWKLARRITLGLRPKK